MLYEPLEKMIDNLKLAVLSALMEALQGEGSGVPVLSCVLLCADFDRYGNFAGMRISVSLQEEGVHAAKS